MPLCKLLVCDLDNTLLKSPKISSWQLIWDFLDCDEAIRKHGLNSFKNGTFNYEQWCAHDTATFREQGLHRDHFSEICKDMKPSPNLRKTLDILKLRGVRMAIVSGALDTILETALPWYGEFFSDIHVNKAHFCSEGYLEMIEPTPYDFEGKRDCVFKLCAAHGISPEHTVFIGDGPNDISLAGQVGLTIAFGSETPEVKDAFDVDLPDDDFSRILEHME